MKDLDWQELEIDDAFYRAVVLAYDRTNSRRWPRQRSHFVVSPTVDRWQIVVELHSYDAYDPEVDAIASAEVVKVSVEPVWYSAGGDTPSEDLLSWGVTPSFIAHSKDVLLEAVKLVPESDTLRGWYRLPKPTTTPTKRGKGGRNVREFSELAALYMYACEVDPVAPVKWLSQEFAYTGYPSSWWHGIAQDLTKRGFLEERQPGQAGGTLTDKALQWL